MTHLHISKYFFHAQWFISWNQTLSSILYEEINLKLLYMVQDAKAANNRSFCTVKVDV